MNPNSGEVGPNFEQPEVPAETPESEQKTVLEQQPARQEAGVAKRAPAPALPVPSSDDDLASLFSTTTTSPTTASPASTDSKITDKDSRAMEKQWVNRAKKVVSQTQDDPHTQKQQMSKVRAEYIKSRFGKTVPTDDTVAA